MILFLAFAGALAWCGATVKLGNKTFFGHVRAIWHTEEVQELKDGVKDTAGPAVHRMERGINAGVNAMKDDGSAAGRDAGVVTPTPAHP
jgi:hypothetical protein